MKQSAKSRPSLCPTKHGWMPPHRRSDKDCLALCWSPRKSLYDESAPVGCQAKEGNPFGPYWDKIGVSFAHDAYFGDLPGGYDLTKPGSKAAWLERYAHYLSDRSIKVRLLLVVKAVSTVRGRFICSLSSFCVLESSKVVFGRG